MDSPIDHCELDILHMLKHDGVGLRSIDLGEEGVVTHRHSRCECGDGGLEVCAAMDNRKMLKQGATRERWNLSAHMLLTVIEKVVNTIQYSVENESHIETLTSSSVSSIVKSLL